jgi:hypothetical protein
MSMTTTTQQRAITPLQQAKLWFHVGDRLLQIENTYIPAMDGSVRRIDKVGVSFYDCTIVDGGGKNHGKPYRGNIPTRASDVVAINDHTITMKVGRGEHTVTLRRVP